MCKVHNVGLRYIKGISKLKTKDNSILTGLRIQISTDPHNFVNLVPDPHSEKLDSDLH
jgi:hypothetical protein